MTGIAEAIAALAGIKTIADGLVSMRDETKVLEVKLALLQQSFEIRKAIDDLQDQLAVVKQEKERLKDENLQLKKRLSEKDEVELVELKGGVYTNVLKGSGKNPPYYCVTCYGEGFKSLLNFEESEFGDSDFPAHLNCPRNKMHTLNLPGGTKASELGFAH